MQNFGSVFFLIYCSIKPEKRLTNNRLSGRMKVRGWIAQSVEQRPEKPCVVGSIPTLATMWHRCSSFFGKFFSEGYFGGREQDARDGVSKIRFLTRIRSSCRFLRRCFPYVEVISYVRRV